MEGELFSVPELLEFHPGTASGKIEVLSGLRLMQARATVKARHYTRSIPSGKSHWLNFEGAIVVWSIPANCNIGKFLTGGDACSVWELARLWAQDGHEKNLLTRAISAAVRWIRR